MNATMSLETPIHKPVMLKEILSILSPQHGGTYIDCTFGAGGYTKAILKFPKTNVYAFDRDKITKKYVDSVESIFQKRFHFFLEKFSNLENSIKDKLNPQAIIFDLGLSSMQISDTKRGFSFKSNGPLNMQMGINNCTVYELINNSTKEDLAKIIKVFGEENEAKRIASAIINYRSSKSIENSQELVSIIRRAKKRKKIFKKDPATKTFQALRMFVNNEISELINGLFSATKILKEDGILVVVSFHSIEDKIVKNFFKFYSESNKNPSRYLPKKNSKEKNLDLFKTISKKALTPDEDELAKNIRARSAKLRYAVRNNNSFFQLDEFKKKFENYLKIEEMVIA